MALVCGRCKKEVGFFGRLSFDQARQRCKECAVEVTRNLLDWRNQFQEACADGLLTSQEWQDLERQRDQLKLDPKEVTEFTRRDALNFVERAFTFAKSDGYLSEDEEFAILRLMNMLQLNQAAPHIHDELSYFRRLREIQAGHLETIQPSIVLPADELCYLEVAATYHKVLTASTKFLPGRLIVTNKKILFVAVEGGGEIPLKKVLNVQSHRSGVFLELSRKANNGFYAVQEPQLVAETLLTVLRIANRQLIAPSEGRDTRRIPQHVKAAVWQRDQGQCVQCAATEYLEFDHIIPYSKGGATSENNLQLLCRRCNLEKSNLL